MADGGPIGPAVLVFGLASAAAWGASDFGGGLTSRRVSVFALVFATQLVGMVVAAALALVRGETIGGVEDIAWAVLAGTLGMVGILSLYAGLAVGRMGVVAPVTGVLGAMVPVVVGIVLEGLPPAVVLVGIGTAILAVVMVSRVPGEAGQRSGIELALLGGLAIGAFNVAITRVEEGFVFGALTVLRVTAAVLLGAAIAVTRRPVAIPRRLLPTVVGIGLLDMAGNATFLFAAQAGPLAVAAVLSSLYPVGTVILAALVLRERVTRGHGVGIALAAVAIVLIASGRGAG